MIRLQKFAGVLVSIFRLHRRKTRNTEIKQISAVLALWSNTRRLPIAAHGDTATGDCKLLVDYTGNLMSRC